MKHRLAKLVPPQADKNSSFQMINTQPGDNSKVIHAFSSDEVRPAQPFLQGCDGGWIMVEFWNKDMIAVQEAAKHLFKLFGLPFLEGNFTREELGLA